MENCEQMEGLSVLEHGIMVCQYFDDLYNFLNNGEPLQYEWKLPEWITDNMDLIINELLDLDIVRCYLVYHDCGKPYCRIVDEEGKQHFPEHAKVSKEKWLEINGDADVASLIEMDMDIHLLKDAGCVDFAKRKEAITLLIAGLSEIHANASMFGGIDSTSFKIKWKQISKRGKKILALKTL